MSLVGCRSSRGSAGSAGCGLSTRLKPQALGQHSCSATPSLPPAAAEPPQRHPCPRLLRGQGQVCASTSVPSAAATASVWGWVAQTQLRVLYKNVFKLLFTPSTPLADERGHGAGAELRSQGAQQHHG